MKAQYSQNCDRNTISLLLCYQITMWLKRRHVMHIDGNGHASIQALPSSKLLMLGEISWSFMQERKSHATVLIHETSS